MSVPFGISEKRAAVPPPLAERRAGPFALRLYPASHPTADVEIAAALAGLLAAAALLLLPLDAWAPLAGSCRFHDWTGIPCLTCGTTRAVLALAHGHPLTALRLNALVALALLSALVYAPAAAAMWLLRLPRPRLALARGRARWGAVAVCALILALQWAFLIWDGR